MMLCPLIHLSTGEWIDVKLCCRGRDILLCELRSGISNDCWVKGEMEYYLFRGITAPCGCKYNHLSNCTAITQASCQIDEEINTLWEVQYFLVNYIGQPRYLEKNCSILLWDL